MPWAMSSLALQAEFFSTTPHPSALRRALGFAAFRAKRGKNEGFAPLCGAAATPVAALKTPVAQEEGTTLVACSLDVPSC